MTMFTTTEIAQCANCGAKVSTRGAPPKSGKRFCQQRPCRAAKARLDRARLSDTREAPTTCAGCGDALKSRPWRSGDEFGRWCKKSLCRGRRRVARDALAGGIDMARRLEIRELAIDLLSTAVQADAEDNHFSSRVVCRECGLTTALLGWVHPGNVTFTAACKGTLDGQTERMPSMNAIQRAWPFPLRFLSADELRDLPD